MPKTDDKVTCRTPTPGKKPTRIDRWKYDLLRKAILKVVPKKGEGVDFWDLPRLIEDEVPLDLHAGATFTQRPGIGIELA